ncbi:MAG: hypothetical protein HFG16_08285 [Erysipelotrichaceae bacterium]|jgi:hypothetical protein|nr:hypothetical protein [Erysipelotrichaceae bacterium]
MKSDYMLTGKDLLYIEDCIGQTDALHTRLSHEISLIQEKEVEKEVNTIMKTLVKIDERLLSLVEKEVHNG